MVKYVKFLVVFVNKNEMVKCVMFFFFFFVVFVSGIGVCNSKIDILVIVSGHIQTLFFLFVYTSLVQPKAFPFCISNTRPRLLPSSTFPPLLCFLHAHLAASLLPIEDCEFGLGSMMRIAAWHLLTMLIWLHTRPV